MAGKGGQGQMIGGTAISPDARVYKISFLYGFLFGVVTWKLLARKHHFSWMQSRAFRPLMLNRLQVSCIFNTADKQPPTGNLYQPTN